MDSIVLHLQGMAIDPKTSVTDLLRLAKTIATKLEDSDALAWIDFELNGYGEKPSQELPSYRKILGKPYALNKHDVWDPISFEESEKYEEFATASICEALSSIEATLKKAEDDPEGHFIFGFSPEDKNELMKGLKSCTGYDIETPLDCHIRISFGDILNVVDSVRNRIHEWSLKLETAGILGEGMNFSQKEKPETVQVIQFINNINNKGVIGAVGDVSGQAQVAGVTHGLNIAEVQALVQQILEAGPLLSQHVGPQINGSVRELEQGLAANSLDEGRIRTLLGSIRSICEGVAVSVLAQGIVSRIGKILGV